MCRCSRVCREFRHARNRAERVKREPAPVSGRATTFCTVSPNDGAEAMRHGVVAGNAGSDRRSARILLGEHPVDDSLAAMSVRLLFIVAVAATLASCSGTTLGRFSVEEPLPPSRVAGLGLASSLPLTLSAFALDVTASDAYAQEDFDYVTEIRIPTIELVIDDSSEDARSDRIEDGMPDDFSFLSSIELFIEASIDGRTQRARLGGLPENDPAFAEGARMLSLQMSNIDILRYVEAPGGYRVEINATGNAPPDDVVFAGAATYQVGVGFD